MRLANIDAKSCLLLRASAAALSLLAGPALGQNAIGTEAETVVVTGTRVQGMTAADSAAPITVLGSEALTQGSGTIDLRQSLGQTVPSFTAESSASDTARLNLNAALRGLSPNDTLVMVNGKRRHGTANLNVSSVNSFAGGAAPVISMIPTGAVDHVEVLLDGAAAQYGTDAIAGMWSTSSSRRIPRAAILTAQDRPQLCPRCRWQPYRRQIRYLLQHRPAAIRQRLHRYHPGQEV